MDAKEFQSIVEAIDDLVAEARTTGDRDRRTKCLEDALKRACQLMTKLNRRLRTATEHVLTASGLGNEHAELAFRDAVQGDEGFAPFQSREALLDFLAAAEPLLVAQMFLNKQRIDEILAQVRDTYDAFMEQRVDVTRLCAQFEMLERFFCRPPFDGGGGAPLLDGGPKDGPSRSRGETVCMYLSMLAAIGSFVTSAIPLFANIWAKGASGAKDAQASRDLALLSLLLLSGYAKSIDEREEVPETAYQPKMETLATR